MLSPEDVDLLCEKTEEAAKAWAEVADRLWEENPKSRKAVYKLAR
jgi:hypothetical protein